MPNAINKVYRRKYEREQILDEENKRNMNKDSPEIKNKSN